MTALDVIPPMTHPLASGWDQPRREDIDITLSSAWMSKRAFNQLHEYNTTLPTGVYEGKMFKRKICWRRIGETRYYRLIWFDKDDNPSKCSIHSRRIQFDENINGEYKHGSLRRATLR